MLKHFGISGALTLAAILAALFGYGFAAAVTTIVLIAIEIAFSFDNAILNAKVLDKLSKLWQQLFLTLGIVVAIFGMRLVFPIAIVAVTAHLSWQKVVDLALHHPTEYAHHLHDAHIAIASFGGAFLLVLVFYFLLDDHREVLWLHKLERPLQKIGGAFWLAPLAAAVVISILSLLVDHGGEVLRAGLIGIVSYAAIKALTDGLGKLTGQDNTSGKLRTGWAAASSFLYLELLDASFSFDGVLGAFAITDKVIIIALGLGVGAIWVRSLTVYMVRRKTLEAYIYLEHGAHYAILVLAAALLYSLFHEVPDAVTGITGLGVILASFVASRQALHARHKA